MPVMDIDTPITPAPAPSRPRAGRILGIILGGILTLGGAAVGVGLAVHHGSGPTPQQQAIAACETAVKAQLKSPATAGFSGETTSPAGSGYYVEGNVDAQNGFGALIRSHWTCSTTPATNGRWLGNATIDEN
jgi:hypothetical protein